MNMILLVSALMFSFASKADCVSDYYKIFALKELMMSIESRASINDPQEVCDDLMEFSQRDDYKKLYDTERILLQEELHNYRETITSYKFFSTGINYQYICNQNRYYYSPGWSDELNRLALNYRDEIFKQGTMATCLDLYKKMSAIRNK